MRLDYEQSPCVCMCAIEFEALKGTSEEWSGGVACDPHSDRMLICESY